VSRAWYTKANGKWDLLATDTKGKREMRSANKNSGGQVSSSVAKVYVVNSQKERERERERSREWEGERRRKQVEMSWVRHSDEQASLA